MEMRLNWGTNREKCAPSWKLRNYKLDFQDEVSYSSFCVFFITNSESAREMKRDFIHTFKVLNRPLNVLAPFMLENPASRPRREKRQSWKGRTLFSPFPSLEHMWGERTPRLPCLVFIGEQKDERCLGINRNVARKLTWHLRVGSGYF